MSAVLLKESRMPFAVRVAGQAFAIAYATRSLMFIALVWAIPSYAIQAPPKVAITPRTRRGSADTALSGTSTLLDDPEPLVVVLEVPPAPERVKVDAITIAQAQDEVQVQQLPKKKKSQIFSKLSSSVAPVARHITIPTKKLTASVATKMTPRKIVACAQAKCSSVVSSVHVHIPRQLPHFNKNGSNILHISPKKGAAVFASCNATMRKLVVVPDSVKWHRPRKHASL